MPVLIAVAVEAVAAGCAVDAVVSPTRSSVPLRSFGTRAISRRWRAQFAGGVEPFGLGLNPQAEQVLRRFLPGQVDLLVAHFP